MLSGVLNSARSSDSTRNSRELPPTRMMRDSRSAASLFSARHRRASAIVRSTSGVNSAAIVCEVTAMRSSPPGPSVTEISVL